MVASDQTFASSSILIVDDEETNVILLQRMLSRAGYKRLTSTTDSRDVMRLVEDSKPDLILLDLMMPHIDGYEILAQLATRATSDAYLPVLVLTADVSPQALQRSNRLSGKTFPYCLQPYTRLCIQK